MLSAILFVLNLLFLIFFGETEFAYFCLLPLSLWLIFSWKKTDFQQFNFSKHKYILSFLLLLILLIVFLFFQLSYSVSLPFSLLRLAFLLISFATFIFFLFQKSNLKAKQDFLIVWQIMSLVLSIMVLIFGFLPQMKQVFPGMNMLYSSYGHNHFAAWLLLMLPFYYFYYLKTARKITLVSIIIFYLVIILSFARIVLLLSVLQLMMVFVLAKKRNSKVFLASKKFFIIIFLLLVSFLSLQIIFSILPNFSDKIVCYQSFIFRNFCKNAFTDPRPDYWQKFSLIVREHFLRGTGLGTSSLIYPLGLGAQAARSAYAHNDWLQFFAELGVFGGSLNLLLMLTLIYIFYRLGKDKQNDLASFAVLSLLSLYLNVLFDFDWQFAAIYLSTFLFAGVSLNLLLVKSSLKKRVDNSASFFLRFNRYFYLLIVVLVFIFALFSSLSLLAQRNNRVNLSFKLFSYQRKLDFYFKNEQQLPLAAWQKLDKINRHNFNYLFKRYALLEDRQDQLEVFQQMFLLAGPGLLNDKMVTNFVDYLASEQFSLNQKKELIDRIFWHWPLAFTVESENKYHDQFFSYQVAQQIATQVFNLVEQALKQADDETAFKLFNQALLIDNWVLLAADGETFKIFLKQYLLADENLRLNPNQYQLLLKIDQILNQEKAWSIILSPREMLDWQQFLAIQAHDHQDFETAIKTLELMTTTYCETCTDYSANDYWSRVQLANYYWLIDQQELASKAAQSCLLSYPNNQDCKNLIANLDSQPDLAQRRFFEVADIIFGRHDWRDFD